MFGMLGAAPVPADPFLWLESVSSPRAMAWVKAENAKTLAVLQRDPRFAGLDADALAVGQSHDRIPTPDIINGRVYNFWQDADHVRGIWRSTTIADYATPAPSWTTVLDLDALAASERKNWVWKGADCDSPRRDRCLISLSDGGADAVTIREFDLATGNFVAGGFELPNGKQDAAWADDDTLLVTREWTPGERTASGYGYVVKRVVRGEPLAAATEVFRGLPSDVAALPSELHDGQGHRVLLIHEYVAIFEQRIFLVTPGGAVKIAIPGNADVEALAAGQVLVALREPWTVNGTTLPSGALVSFDATAAAANPQQLDPVPVYVPGVRESFDNVTPTLDGAIVTSLDNVRGRAAVYTASAGGRWSRRALALPDNAASTLVSSNEYGAEAYVRVAGFLTPPTMVQVDAHAVQATVVKTLPAQFDASGDVVEQLEATSKDGTRIPYFLVRPKRMRFDGSTPTILNAYGGFGVSSTPFYSGTLGKLWLERGGAFVLANIRGGGEFGPAWHDAGLKTKRQVIFDDFAAVGRDLIARRITSPRRLGIVGGSNGGLLMGVEFEQHPDLWNAVQIEIPLLDMLRYEQIAAGASWVGEYGSVSVPAERAFLAKISPYQNLKAGVRYPEPFIWTTTKDDRVGPQHARKFAAKLAALRIPYLYYEVTEGGHAAGANIKETAFTSALGYVYFARKLMDPRP
jgi:prolyl oligopeptidase